jgi:hypothetical protein
MLTRKHLLVGLDRHRAFGGTAGFFLTSADFQILKMEAIYYSEKLEPPYKITRYHIQKT